MSRIRGKFKPYEGPCGLSQSQAILLYGRDRFVAGYLYDIRFIIYPNSNSSFLTKGCEIWLEEECCCELWEILSNGNDPSGSITNTIKRVFVDEIDRIIELSAVKPIFNM